MFKGLPELFFDFFLYDLILADRVLRIFQKQPSMGVQQNSCSESWKIKKRVSEVEFILSKVSGLKAGKFTQTF